MDPREWDASLPLLSGGNALQPLEDRFGSSIPFSDAQFFSDVAKYWEGFGEAITEMVCCSWNTSSYPITAAEGMVAGIAAFSKHPSGALRAIGQQIADAFTGGDLRMAGKLVGFVLLSVASPESEPEELAALLAKVEAAVAGKEVSFTAAELDTIPGLFSKIGSTGNWERKLWRDLAGIPTCISRPLWNGDFLTGLLTISVTSRRQDTRLSLTTFSFRLTRTRRCFKKAVSTA